MNENSIYSEMIVQARKVEGESAPRERRKTNAQDFLNRTVSSLRSLKPSNWAENRILFDGLKKILFYVKDDRFNSVLEKLYWDLDKRNFSKDQDREIVYEYYIRSRQIDKAQSFVKKLPEWQSRDFIKPPQITIDDTFQNVPTIMEISGKNSLIARSFPLKKYTGLIIIGSPHCGWTKRALKDIQEARTKRKLFNEPVRLITPQEDLSLEAIHKWNKENPSLPYTISYKESSFEGFNFDTVPYFYFLKNGQIIKKFSGWPRKGNWKVLEDGFLKISKSSSRSME